MDKTTLVEQTGFELKFNFTLKYFPRPIARAIFFIFVGLPSVKDKPLRIKTIRESYTVESVCTSVENCLT